MSNGTNQKKIEKKSFFMAVLEKKLKNWPELPPVTLLGINRDKWGKIGVST